MIIPASFTPLVFKGIIGANPTPKLINFTESQVKHIATQSLNARKGRGESPVVESRTRAREVEGSSPGSSGGRIIFSLVNILCWPLFRYSFHPRVIAVEREKSWPFCQKCRWQVTAKDTCTLRMSIANKVTLFTAPIPPTPHPPLSIRTCDETAAL